MHSNLTAHAARAEGVQRSLRDGHLHGAFGQDAFGRGAESAARFFGTPRYIVAQTLAVAGWIALNAVGLISHWDPYPFILLNLAFSTQAAYAAPLILLAQTRQADRDKHAAMRTEERHQEEEQRAKATLEELRALLDANTELTRRDEELTGHVASLVRAIHEHELRHPVETSSPPPADDGPTNGRRRGSMLDSEDATAGVGRFQIVSQKDGRYHWQLFNPQGTPAVRSLGSYATEEEAVAVALEAQRLISRAPIERSSG
jgi:uncharacterized membrane protein